MVEVGTATEQSDNLRRATYLDAIAASVFTSQAVSDWLIKGTPVEAHYTGSSALIEEQQAVRWRAKQTKQPFWANYWCGRDAAVLAGLMAAKDLNQMPFSFFEMAPIVFWLHTSNSNIGTSHLDSDSRRLTRCVRLAL